MKPGRRRTAARRRTRRAPRPQMTTTAFRELFAQAPASIASLRAAAHAPPLSEAALAAALFGESGALLRATGRAAFLLLVAEVGEGERAAAHLVCTDNYVRHVVERVAALDGTWTAPLVVAGPVTPAAAQRAAALFPSGVPGVAQAVAELVAILERCGVPYCLYPA
jgi:hypothetical protein